MLLWQPSKLHGLFKATISAEDSLNTLCIISVTLVKLQIYAQVTLFFVVSHFECVLKRRKNKPIESFHKRYCDWPTRVVIVFRKYPMCSKFTKHVRCS